MKGINDELVSEEAIQPGINITLHKNVLDKNRSYYAKVHTKVASVKAVLSRINEENKGVDVVTLKNGLELYDKQVIKLLKEGYSVKILDLGVLIIKHRGKVADKAEADGLSDFTVEFIPNDKVLEAVKDLEVDAVLIGNGKEPVMGEITDLARKVSDGKITAGKGVRIMGHNIKMDLEKDELYIVPQNSDGTAVENMALWYKVEGGDIFRNKPTELNFTAPLGLENDVEYRIVIRYWRKDGEKIFYSPCESDSFYKVGA